MERIERKSELAVQPTIAIKLVQQSDPQVEAGLRDAFTTAATISDDPRIVAERVAAMLGRGCTVVPEAERGAWSRYRVSVRVLGEPVTIASVEVTQR